MDFPESQQTGALAEDAVAQLFLSWGWNVGRDRIDVGYDLCVTPSRDKYQGSRFLVQVKGTTEKRTKGRVVAQVAKARLRQYADDILPVFIVRVTADGQFFWLHAQPWAKANRQKLDGYGNSGVRLDPSCSLHAREHFEGYLESVLRESIADAQAAEERRFVSSLDPRLDVQFEVRNGIREHRIFAKAENVNANFSFKPSASEGNLANIRDAIQFGLPRSVDVENFSMAGSPVFDHIGANSARKGTITISNLSPEDGVVRLMPGRKFSLTAPELALDVELFRGHGGAAITNERKASLFSFNTRLAADSSTAGKMNFQLGVRPDVLAGQPIQELSALRPIASWAEQVALHRSIYLGVEFKRFRGPASGAVDEGLYGFLSFARTISRLHLVAKSLDSSLTFPESSELSAEEVSDINLAYVLLKGERHPVTLGPIEFDPPTPLTLGVREDLFCATTLTLTVLNQRLGEIPVSIELSGYAVEAVSGSSRLRLSEANGKGRAWISYSEHGLDGVCVRRGQSG